MFVERARGYRLKASGWLNPIWAPELVQQLDLQWVLASQVEAQPAEGLLWASAVLVALPMARRAMNRSWTAQRPEMRSCRTRHKVEFRKTSWVIAQL